MFLERYVSFTADTVLSSTTLQTRADPAITVMGIDRILRPQTPQIVLNERGFLHVTSVHQLHQNKYSRDLNCARTSRPKVTEIKTDPHITIKKGCGFVGYASRCHPRKKVLVSDIIPTVGWRFPVLPAFHGFKAVADEHASGAMLRPRPGRSCDSLTNEVHALLVPPPKFPGLFRLGKRPRYVLLRHPT